MRTLVRGLAALALVTGLVTATGRPADAGPVPDDSISIDVVVVGTPPAGASVDVIVDYDEPRFTHTVDLADTSADPDIASFAVSGLNVGWAVYLDPEADAGADSISYTCTINTGDPSSCQDNLSANQFYPAKHAYASNLALDTPEQMDFTVTITFDPPVFCDGREATVVLADGDEPTAGADVIVGTPESEAINGLGGADRICGRGGTDTLRGGPGRDRVFGEGGADRLEGGADGDTLVGGASTDTLLGQAGNDALDGGTQRDTCNGGPQQDTGVRCEVRNGIP